MKKFLLVLTAVTLFASVAEARDRRGDNHHGRNDRGRNERVVVVNRDCGHGRGGCHCRSYRAGPMRQVVYTTPYYYQGSSVYFSNRNFAFGFSNFLW